MWRCKELQRRHVPPQACHSRCSVNGYLCYILAQLGEGLLLITMTGN
ncbi:MAG: hypothetical protein P8179_16975 [Candidatus Thiodiazotropha sp.]